MKPEHVFIQIARPSGRGGQRFGITLCDQDGLAKPDYSGRRVQATLNLETAPTAIGTPGTPSVVAGPTVNLLAQDMIGIRFIWPVNYSMRDTRGIAFMTGVNLVICPRWTNSNHHAVAAKLPLIWYNWTKSRASGIGEL
jgi:hypothetical protein